MKLLFVFCTAGLLLTGSLSFAGEAAAEKSASPETIVETVSAPEVIWTPAMLEYTIGGPDPIGGWNRGVFAFNDAMMQYLVRPVSWVYCSILPKPVIDVLWNMCRNLEYPMHLFSCLGAAEWQGSWDETRRFFVNTTLGVAGMLDPAQDWFGWQRTDSNFGRMFHVWGIGPGCTFMFPIAASFVNVRDCVGTIFDYAFDLRTYIPYSSWVYANEAVIAENQYNQVMKTVVNDRYHQFRMLMLAKRELQLNLWEYRVKNAAKTIIPEDAGAKVVKETPKPVLSQKYKGWNVTTLSNFDENTQPAEQPYLDSLYSTLFTPQNDHSFWYLRRSIFNRDFISQGKHRELQLSQGKDAMEFDYYFWDMKKEDREAGTPERLVIILPGIGSSPDGNSALAMAELFNDKGWKAVTVWSAFSAQFMESANHGALPGYAPRDAASMRAALQQVLADLRKDELIGEKTWITLLGWSFGGLHALHIASMEEQQNTLGVNRYVALNPPADLDYALSEADKLALTSKGWSREQAVSTIAHALGAAFVTAQESSVALYNPEIKKTRDARLPYIKEMSPDQARFLISLSLNSTLRSVMLSRHLREPLPGLIDSTPANRQYLNLQLDLIPYRAYAENFILLDKTLPQTYAGLAEKSGLKAIEPTLKNNPEIRVFHTLNDFLVSPEQRKYMQDTFGKRIFWFDRGGHLGYWNEQKALDMIYAESSQDAPDKTAASGK